MSDYDVYGYTNSTWTDISISNVPGIEICEPTGKLIVDGRDVLNELDEMRDALLLLKRDVDMEAKYPKLKELKDEYERALDIYKTFEAIKESK